MKKGSEKNEGKGRGPVSVKRSLFVLSCDVCYHLNSIHVMSVLLAVDTTVPLFVQNSIADHILAMGKPVLQCSS